MKKSVLTSFLCIGASACALMAWDAAVKLPPPYHTPNNSNGAKVIPQPDGVSLKVPQGFKVEEFAKGFKKPRVMVAGRNGEILVADSVPNGGVFALVGSEKKPLIEGLDRPYGMSLWKDYLYVAEPASLKRYKYDGKALSAGKGEEIISLPKDFDKGHWTRSITFDPKGLKLYLNIGSGSNHVPDTDERRATILECNPDGKDCKTFASGLRNSTGIHFRPGSNDLWVTVQERDGLGDDLVPDFFTQVKKGGFYGWPWAYFGPNEDPRNAGQKPELVKSTIVPDVSLGAHSAVMDWTFYNGKQFPEKYRGGAFFAFRGSSNRAKRIGYSLVYLPFGKNGKPSGPVEDFMSGWMLGPDQKEVWGRPTGVVQTADGSLLVSEDGGNKIWKITYAR